MCLYINICLTTLDSQVSRRGQPNLTFSGTIAETGRKNLQNVDNLSLATFEIRVGWEGCYCVVIPILLGFFNIMERFPRVLFIFISLFG